MATHRSTTTGRATTDRATVRAALHSGVLLAAYLGTVLVLSAVSVLTVVYTIAAFDLPVAAVLALWVAGSGGVAVSPAAAQRVVAAIDETSSTGETTEEAEGEAARRGAAPSAPDGDPEASLVHGDADESREPAERVLPEDIEYAGVTVAADAE